MVLRTCKRCIRTGVNDLSGLYSGASPYRAGVNAGSDGASPYRAGVNAGSGGASPEPFGTSDRR
jgi:hypothetical protein